MACNFISKRVAKILLWISLVVLVFSVTLIVVFPTIYKSALKEETTLGKGSIISNIWMDIPLPIYEKVYFFNITNKDQFLKGDEPLNVTEVGPYVYKSRWVKNNPAWNSNNTVSYREVRTYHFVPELSRGTQEDEIYSLNGPLLIASSIAKDYDETLRAFLSVLLSIEGEKVVIKKKIKQLVYDGYDDFIIKYATLLKPDIPYKNGMFSWLYGKNATDDGLYTVFTGVDDQSKTNFINKWNGEEQLNFWKGDTCNMLNGTSIETGPPIHDDQDSYTFFQSIFCRSLPFKYTEDQTHFDIPSKRFRPTYSVFANSTENPENYCFEVGKERASGVLDVSPCQFGAPAFISFPHFHLADPSYLESVTGLNPIDEKHGSYIDVEPTTGLSINLVTYNPMKGIFPVLWVELGLEINEDLADFLKSKMRNPKIISYSVLGVLAAVSLVLAIVCFVVLYSSNPEDDDEPLINVKDEYPAYYGASVPKGNLQDSEEKCKEESKTESHENYRNSTEYAEKDSFSNGISVGSPQKS